jgi:hypothetical protein
MTTRLAVRASDAERDRVADLLREHTAQGRLTLDEFTDRVGAAYAATTRGELNELVADLPVAPPAPDHGDPTAARAVTRPSTGMSTCLRDIPPCCLLLLLVVLLA